MPLPGFLLPSRPIPISAAVTTATAPIGGTATSANALTFVMQHQQLSQWCWAAVSASVAGFYGSGLTSQCAIASAEQSLVCCPANTAASGCDVAWYLDRALQRVGHFDRLTFTPEAFATVSSEVDGGRPLCARIAWSTVGAHFLALIGWSIDAAGSEYVDVEDPFYGFTTATYSSFCTSYRTPGDTWTHSYFTAMAPAAGGGVVAGAPLSV